MMVNKESRKFTLDELKKRITDVECVISDMSESVTKHEHMEHLHDLEQLMALLIKSKSMGVFSDISKQYYKDLKRVKNMNGQQVGDELQRSALGNIACIDLLCNNDNKLDDVLNKIKLPDQKEEN